MIRHARRPPRRGQTIPHHSLPLDDDIPPDPIEKVVQSTRSTSVTRCLLEDIDYSKLTNQVEGHPTARGTALLLQALRQQVSMSALAEYSARSLDWIIDNDILQLKQRKNSLMCRVLQSDAVDAREQMARLVNTIASYSRGRSYLAAHQKSLLPCLVTLVRGRRLPTSTFDQIVATLQKLSVRPSCQRELLQNGLLEWVVNLLETRCSPYAMEYAAALASNISLNPSSSTLLLRFADSIAAAAVSVLNRDIHGVSLHRSRDGFQQCCSLFNGLVYVWLSCGKIRVRARETKLADSIRARISKKSCSLCALHVPYLLAIIAAEAEIVKVPTAPHDQQDVDTAGDSCERDVDSADPLRPSSNELSGARLLLRRAPKEFSPGEAPRRSPPSKAKSEPRLGTATSCHTFIVDVERRRPLVLPVGLTDGAIEYKKACDQKAEEARKAEEAKEKEKRDREERQARLGRKHQHGSKKDLGSTERLPQRKPKLAQKTTPPLKVTEPDPPAVTTETEQENFTPEEYATVFASRPKVARTPDQNRSFF